MANGYVFYAGPSALDPSIPIVGIVILNSRNSATGNMAQTFILRQDMPPMMAVQTGQDAPICGNCPLRAGNGCYVQVAQAPNAIFRTWKAGKYPPLPAKWQAYAIRHGAYGDPCAVPRKVALDMLLRSTRHTGYTSQWRTNPWAARWLMASCHTVAQYKDATAQGWRCFVAAPEEPALPYVAECLKQSTPGATCASCLGCDGNPSGVAGGFWIKPHGAWKNRHPANKRG